MGDVKQCAWCGAKTKAECKAAARCASDNPSSGWGCLDHIHPNAEAVMNVASEALKPENQRIYPVGTTRDYESELAALREELEMARDDLVIFKGAISALGEASKKLVVCARTTGGTAGPDSGLMDACAGVESVITLGGIARAMNEFEQLTAERDDLVARLEQARDRKNSIVDLQQRLTAAEQRNAELERAILTALDDSCEGPGAAEVTIMRIDYDALCGLIAKPTESGASDADRKADDEALQRRHDQERQEYFNDESGAGE